MKITVLSAYAHDIKKHMENLPSGVEARFFKDENELDKGWAEGSEVLFCNWISQDAVGYFKNVRWVHTPWAGVDSIIDKIPRGAAFTRTVSVNDHDIARYVCGYVLYFSQKIRDHLLFQAKKEWDWTIKREEFSDKKVGIFGLGRIGAKIAECLSCLGYEVYAYKKRKAERCPGFIKRIFYGDEKEKLLSESDYVILILPLTRETKGFIGKDELAIMKESAVLINVGRGELVKEDDLADAMEKKIIKAAVLDVFEKEPLPKDSPLWKMEDVIVTPHDSGHFFFKDRADYFLENLERFIDGEELQGRVSLHRGY